jgi:hypothetical protein
MSTVHVQVDQCQILRIEEVLIETFLSLHILSRDLLAPKIESQLALSYLSTVYKEPSSKSHISV